MSVNPLGSTVEHPRSYAPHLLFPIPRESASQAAFGIDHWHAYELSWLSSTGLPQVAMAEFFFDLRAPNIIESKSLKLYLNSLNQTGFASRGVLESTLQDDLSRCSGSAVRIELTELRASFFSPSESGFQALDTMDVSIDDYSPQAVDVAKAILLQDAALATETVNEAVFSDIFRSNCPVTGQPDWATVLISYEGRKIVQENLLRYLCAYRNHQAYHEQCADQIFSDLQTTCRLERLELSMHFLRRGGLDINCHRSTQPLRDESIRRRLHRQ